MTFGKHPIDILPSNGIAVFAALVAELAALYARRSAREAKKANDIGRLNALLALWAHYLELMAQKERNAEQMKGEEKADEAIADLDSKFRKISKAIDEHHE